MYRYFIGLISKNTRATYYNDRGLTKSSVLLLQRFNSQFIRFQLNFKNPIVLLQRLDPFLKLFPSYRGRRHHYRSSVNRARVAFRCAITVSHFSRTRISFLKRTRYSSLFIARSSKVT